MVISYVLLYDSISGLYVLLSVYGESSLDTRPVVYDFCKLFRTLWLLYQISVTKIGYFSREASEHTWGYWINFEERMIQSVTKL